MPSATTLYAVASVVLVSVVSLVGILGVAVSERRLKRVLFILVSLAAGGLLGDAFIHLLPHSYEKPRTGVSTAVCVLAGIWVFFALEKFLRWRHEHVVATDSRIHPVGYLNLIADGLHNLIDGLLIGASYLAGLRVGLATTLAVILHEIPQEIGDFGVLVQAGFTRTRALLFNLVSASVAIAGTVVALLIGQRIERFTAVMLPLAAGGFVYIAGSDLLPELNKDVNPLRSTIQLASMILGAGLMMLLAQMG
jgi:zinc and cadmium transporter